MKPATAVFTKEPHQQESEIVASPVRGGTHHDQRDMQRMGKNQELMRIFRSFSTFSFTVMIQCTWEFILVANYVGLSNGGMAGMFWSFIWTYGGFTLIVLSLAEMGSIAPTSGGQYHWVSEFAPPKYQRFLSYLTGWMSALSWQAGGASGAYLIGTLIQALISLNRPVYEPERWQGTLFVIGVAFIVFNINVWGAKALPFLQNCLLILHVCGFAVIVIVLWVIARVQSAKAVFTQFENHGGWDSMGLSLMIGQIAAVYVATCTDAAAHISEEVRDAGLVIPRAMVISFFVNGFLGVIALVTFLFCIPSVYDALNDSTGYPILYVLRSSMPNETATGLMAILLILMTASNIDFAASASRQIFALARDKGLPFSTWIAHVHPKLHVPVNALMITSGTVVLLSLINIGSTTAFNAIISLQLAALMMTYAVSIACILYRRLQHPELLPHARWSLGRFGPAINAGGLAYATFIFFWCFWPIQTPVQPNTFNWAVVIFWSVTIGSGVVYLAWGRKNYVGPVALVKNHIIISGPA